MKTIEQFLQENSNFDGFVGIFQPISNAKSDELSGENITRITSNGETNQDFIPLSFFDNIDFKEHLSPYDPYPRETPQIYKVFVPDNIFENKPVQESPIKFWRENGVSQADINALLDMARFSMSCSNGKRDISYEFAVGDDSWAFMIHSLLQYYQENLDKFEATQSRMTSIPYPYNANEAKKDFLESLSKVYINLDCYDNCVSYSLKELLPKIANGLDKLEDFKRLVFDETFAYKEQMKARKQK